MSSRLQLLLQIVCLYTSRGMFTWTCTSYCHAQAQGCEAQYCSTLELQLQLRSVAQKVHTHYTRMTLNLPLTDIFAPCRFPAQWVAATLNTTADFAKGLALNAEPSLAGFVAPPAASQIL